MGQKVINLLAAMANATPLKPDKGAKRTPNTTQQSAQRTIESASGSSRSTPVSNCPGIMRHTPTAVYINSQRIRWVSGTAEGPAQRRIRGFATRASATARGTPKATETNVAFLKAPLIQSQSRRALASPNADMKGAVPM